MTRLLLVLLLLSGPAHAEGWTVAWNMPDSIETAYDLERYYFILASWTYGNTHIDTLHAPTVRDSAGGGLIYFSTTAGEDSTRYWFRLHTYVPSNSAQYGNISEPSNVVSGLLLDWSQKADVTIWKIRGDDSDVLAAALPYGPWGLTWYTMNPDTVEAIFELDLAMDGIINLSDLSHFAQGYNSIYDLSDFSILCGMYQKRAWLRFNDKGAK